MSDKWRSVLWQKLDPAMQQLAHKVKRRFPKVHVASEQSTNQSFPFRACLSFSIRQLQVDDEDVVVSIDCWRHNGSLMCTVDVARGNGYILSDGPKCIVKAITPEAISSILQWNDDVIQFLGASVELVIAELSKVSPR